MAVRIFLDIRFPFSSAMIYYGAKSDTRDKTFAYLDFPESSLFISRCLNSFSALC